jgi:pimeloyl-ACP methyl ester carboxylesterase
MERLHKREWGRGEPILALHPLGLDSSAFSGFGRLLAAASFRTVAVDLPGFGRTPYPNEPLTPQRLARPVIAMARRMKTRPMVVGISLGGRVALECVLRDPGAFRGVIAIAPYLPWLRYREMLRWARFLNPDAAERFPLECAWPVLRLLAETLQRTPILHEDELAQAGARLIYFLSCPATRASFISAARELALDSAYGPEGFWTRLPELALPASFVWGGADRLVSLRFSEPVAQTLPGATQITLPCVAHALNGPHHRCLANAVRLLLESSGEENCLASPQCIADPRGAFSARQQRASLADQSRQASR